MDYAALRLIHITCALLSLAGFFLRGILMLRDSPWLDKRLTRTLPHINDTILLAAAIALVAQSGQYPWQQAWLGTKVIALLCYIGLGSVAFRFGSTVRARLAAWVMALAVFGWMLSIARFRSPLGIFSLL